MKILPLSVSSPPDPVRYHAGVKILEVAGHQMMQPAMIRKAPQDYLNGSDEERLSELSQALRSSADAVWAVRGGYGMTRLLPQLSCKKAPPVIGFSDTSALLLHLWKHARTKGLHAPGIQNLQEEPVEVLQALELIFGGKARQVQYPGFTSPFEKGGLRGILLAANLSILTELIGTHSMPSLEGCILVLEDANEKPYKLDRMLTHLHSANALNGVQAILVGHLTSCGEKPEQVFIERCGTFGIPCFTGLQSGHESPNWPVPVGVQAEIQMNGGKACLKILEELF